MSIFHMHLHRFWHNYSSWCILVIPYIQWDMTCLVGPTLAHTNTNISSFQPLAMVTPPARWPSHQLRKTSTKVRRSAAWLTSTTRRMHRPYHFWLTVSISVYRHLSQTIVTQWTKYLIQFQLLAPLPLLVWSWLLWCQLFSDWHSIIETNQWMICFHDYHNMTITCGLLSWSYGLMLVLWRQGDPVNI